MLKNDFPSNRYNELQDPTYQYKIDIGHFMVRTL